MSILAGIAKLGGLADLAGSVADIITSVRRPRPTDELRGIGDPQDFQTYLESVRAQQLAGRDLGPVSETKSGALIQSMDANGDGRLQLSEFSGPRHVFERLDRDGDGNITEAELESGLLAMQAAEHREKLVARMLERLDADGDRELTANELGVSKSSIVRSDRNGNGALDRSELLAHYKRTSKPAGAGLSMNA